MVICASRALPIGVASLIVLCSLWVTHRHTMWRRWQAPGDDEPASRDLLSVLDTPDRLLPQVYILIEGVNWGNSVQAG